MLLPFRRKLAGAAGLTTTELLLVVAVLGIIGAIAFVVLPRDRFAVNQAVEGLVADVDLARASAIRGNQYVRLAIEPDQNRYRLVEVAWTGSGWSELRDLKVVGLSDSRTQTARIDGSSALNDLFFDPRGNAIGQGTQTIVIASGSSDFTRIVAISQQGRVSLQ